MLIFFIFLLIPSLLHVTTSLTLNQNNRNNSLTLVNTNNKSNKHENITPSPVLLAATDGKTSPRTILEKDAKSNLILNKNANRKISSTPTSNRYRRNINDLIENISLDPNYNDESNFLPQMMEQHNTNGISSNDWEESMLARKRRGHIDRTPLSEEFSGMQIWNSVNLSGRRERPFYVDEPPYILVRREVEYPELIGEQKELFIPPRGRKSDFKVKKSSLSNLFDTQNSDLFMPNRGKKFDTADQYKRAKYNDILLGDDLFFPNRGKKTFDRTKFTAPTSSVAQLLGTDDFFYPNRGKKSRLASILSPNDLFYPNRGKRTRATFNGGGDLTDLDLFVPNRGKKNLLINKREIVLNDKKQNNKSMTTTPTNIIYKNSNNNNNKKNNNNNNDNKGDRYKRDLLDNLSKEKDTFYSARGRRNINKNKNNNGERINDNNNNNNNNNINEKFMEENNKNFLDDKFYTSNEISKKSTIKNYKNDYGIIDDSRVKSFYFLKQIPSMYGMAGADDMPKTIQHDHTIIKQQQQQHEPGVTLINADNTNDGGQENSMDSSNDINRYTLPRHFDYTDNNVQSNYRK